MMKKYCNFGARISLIYLLAGFVWIISSELLISLVGNIKSITLLAMVKEWSFVSATSAFLYFIISRNNKQLLSLSPKRIETYRSRLMLKLGVSDLAALIKFALQSGITPPA